MQFTCAGRVQTVSGNNNLNFMLMGLTWLFRCLLDPFLIIYALILLCSSVFSVEMSCEPPNNRLDKFKGKLVYKDTMYPLDNENVILRVSCH